MKPDFPNRLKFCGIGLALGLALGLVVVTVFEFLDDRLHAEKDIKAIVPIAVISEIPEIQTPWMRKRTEEEWFLDGQWQHW